MIPLAIPPFSVRMQEPGQDRESGLRGHNPNRVNRLVMTRGKKVDTTAIRKSRRSLINLQIRRFGY